MSGKKATGHEKLIRLCVREDWKCWICGGEVPLDYVEGSPSSPSRDHIVPRSRFRKKYAAGLKEAQERFDEEHGALV